MKALRRTPAYTLGMITLALQDAPLLLALCLALAMGLGAIFAPVLVTRQFDIVDLTASGRNEIRSVYGGFGVAMAIMFAVALSHPSLRAGISLTAAAALAGMAGGRGLSALIDKQIDRAPLAYLCVETVLAGLLVYAA